MTLPKHALDITGYKYGLLTVLGPAGTRKHDHIVWKCSCECGGTIETTGNLLRRGECKSCGCLRRKPLKKYDGAPMKSIVISDHSVVARICQLARDSGTSPSTWALNALEDFILKHRSNRFRPDPDRHAERNEDTTADYFV